MKKYYLAALALLLAVGFTSCSKDDDDDDNKKEQEEQKEEKETYHYVVTAVPFMSDTYLKYFNIVATITTTDTTYTETITKDNVTALPEDSVKWWYPTMYSGYQAHLGDATTEFWQQVKQREISTNVKENQTYSVAYSYTSTGVELPTDTTLRVPLVCSCVYKVATYNDKGTEVSNTTLTLLGNTVAYSIPLYLLDEYLSKRIGLLNKTIK